MSDNRKLKLIAAELRQLGQRLRIVSSCVAQGVGSSRQRAQMIAARMEAIAKELETTTEKE